MALKPEQEQAARELLKKLALFAGCSEEQIAALATRMNAREAAGGKVLLMDQEIGKTLYLLNKGTVSVWKRFEGEKKKLASLAAPNFFGERTIFEESPASALVKAEEPCSMFVLDKVEFDELAKKFPPMKDQIHKNMEVVRAQRITPAKPPETASNTEV